MNDEEILIRKYSNRRFYCVPEARYVSLAEIGALVRSGRPVRVVEKETGKDITRTVLMQVLLEDGADGVPVWFYRLMLQTPREMLDPFFAWFPAVMEWYLRLQEQQRAVMPPLPWGSSFFPGYPGAYPGMMPFFPGQANATGNEDPHRRMEEMLRQLRGETAGPPDEEAEK